MSNRLFIIIQKIVPQRLLSKLAGLCVRSRWSAKLIPAFISYYNVDMSEALQSSARDYFSFHEFFVRHLKPEVRPISKGLMLSPCDGTIADIGSIKNGSILQAKKHPYTIQQLVADTKTAELFTNGSHLTIYLSPKDYHRVHAPCASQLTRWRYLPGKLFSVNTSTAQLVPGLYTCNERLICYFETSAGHFMLIMVGAMLVSGIVSQWNGKHDTGHDSGWQDASIDYNCLDELGQFCFGSTVMLITQQSFSEWFEDLQEQQAIRLGQILIQ